MLGIDDVGMLGIDDVVYMYTHMNIRLLTSMMQL